MSRVGYRADLVLYDEPAIIVTGEEITLAPDGCRWHFLPPDQPVPVPTPGGRTDMVPAGVVCEYLHLNVALARLFDRAARQAAELTHTEVPPAFRKPPPRPVRPAWLEPCR